MKDVAILALRLTTGGLLAGHGAQKLFGWFGGHGIEGTAGWLESIGLRPGRQWATLAGLSEFGGGLLTMLGLFHPAGPMAITAAMTTATGNAHAGKPIWAASGGAELPVTNIAVALALALIGPGRLSLDALFGTRLAWYKTVLLALATLGGIFIALTTPGLEQPAESNERAAAETQGGRGASRSAAA